MNKFLYCGMASDIITPLSLEPDVDEIYSISLVDTAFYKDGTAKGMIGDIIQSLTDGHDDNTSRWDIFKCRRSELKEPCCNIKVDNTGETHSANERWELSFTYLGKPRKLVYYTHRNFYIEWPEEFANITHLSSLGATFEYLKPTLKRMLETRCVPKCIYYDQWDFADSKELVRPIFKCNKLHSDIRTYYLGSLTIQREYYLNIYRGCNRYNDNIGY
jgi:hypothetical protein